MKYLSLSLLVALSACDAAVAVNSKIAAEEAAAPVAVEAAAGADASEKTTTAPDTALAAKVDGKATVQPDAFDLESVSFLVKKGKVKDAPALEKQINDPKEKINNVDIDGDGKVDKIQVLEVRGAADVVVFELRAIPSSTKNKDAAVVIATIDFTTDKTSNQLVVKAVYAPVVVGHETIVYDYVVPIEVKGETIVVVDSSPFYGWLFTVSRPAYVGVYVYEVAPPPVIIFETKHWKGKGKHWGKGKGKGKHWH
ncbi:MAG: hypothetical protein IPO88_14705 [Nannocystis sp.]|uniref:hypothetical protein n=1 Tax=Nannocystis sp. TaxID=1962667 RepID=UPI0024232B8D|nr:hypothetical protein [Nannocystis sp.]MBK9754724.1 hypothetical protein [Nannocystis sp.]